MSDEQPAGPVPVAETGLLLPAASLALLAASGEGAGALREFGMVVDDFDAEFALLSTRLASSSDPEAALALEVSEQIVSLAASAHGWLSVRAMGDDQTPSLALLCEQDVLIARLHGPVVEWVLGDVPAVSRLVRQTVEERGGADVMVTVLSGGVALGGALFRGDTVDVAAVEQPQLELLASAAGRGVVDLLAALAELPSGMASS